MRQKPTPREMRVLRAVEDGCSLKVAAERLGIPVSQVSHILSSLYTRLKIKDLSTSYHTRKDRRRMAVSICKREGWWDIVPEEEFLTTWEGGHALIVEYGDCEFYGRCQCGKKFGMVTPDRFTDGCFSGKWERHVMRDL